MQGHLGKRYPTRSSCFVLVMFAGSVWLMSFAPGIEAFEGVRLDPSSAEHHPSAEASPLPRSVSTDGIAAEPPDVLRVTVDCDSGDDLAEVLQSLSARARIDQVTRPRREGRPVVVLVNGTCVGSFVLPTGNLTLRGPFPGGATLVGTRDDLGRREGTVVTAHQVSDVTLENLTIEGGLVGVSLQHATGRILDTRIQGAEGTGLLLRWAGIFAERISVSSEATAVWLSAGSEGEFIESDLGGGGFMDLSVLNSRAILERGRARVVEARSGGDLVLSRVSGLQSLMVAEASQARLVRVDVAGEIDVVMDSWLEFSTGTVVGEVFLDGFAKARLMVATVDGRLRCSMEANAVCALSTVATVEGCAACAATAPEAGP